MLYIYQPWCSSRYGTWGWAATVVFLICGLTITQETNAADVSSVSHSNSNSDQSSSFTPPLPKSPSLPLQDVNILVLTDVHSWVAGHPHEPHLNANYGHVVSFYENLFEICASQQKDLFFVMNGDFIDGTGLTSYPPQHLTPILEQMPWDAVNIGNHELYKNSTVNYIAQPGGFIDHWDGGYLTSNTLLVETNQTLGGRYKFMVGSSSSQQNIQGGGGGVLTGERNSTILTFGFLYNFQNNCEATKIERVEDVVQSDWFVSVLSGNEGDFDAIVVLAHMGANDPLVNVILSKIREICGNDMTVQFIAGHTHVRMNVTLDAYSESFEAGRFLDTVGFVSFSLNDTTTATEDNASLRHVFIDGNVQRMSELLGKKDFVTPTGEKVQKMIVAAQEEMGLSEVLGCNSYGDLYFKRGLDEEGSLWGFYAEYVIPQQLFEGSTSKLFLQNPGGFRYNLHMGEVTLNDLVSMTPYNDTIYTIGSNVKGTEFVDAFGYPNSIVDPNPWSNLPKMVVSGKFKADKMYDVYSVDFDVEYVKDRLENVTGRTFEPMPIPDMTTNVLWRKYMDEHWVCPDETELVDRWDAILEFFEEFTVMKIIAFLLSFMVIVFFGWMFLCRNVQTTRRFGAVDPADDLSYFDDSGIGEFSEDEDMFPIGGVKSPPQQSSTPSSTTTKNNIGKTYQIIFPVQNEENGIV